MKVEDSGAFHSSPPPPHILIFAKAFDTHRPRDDFGGLKTSQIGAQLYTVRDFCTTALALAETAKKLKSIGYHAVQVSGVSASIPVAEIKTILDDAGLVICATHEDPTLIRHEPLQVVERLKVLGAKFTAYPYPAGIDFQDPAAIKAMVSDLDASGAILRENGCHLSYHNHAIEFIRMGEETWLDYIARATTPENLGFELDTYWVQAGGGDPVAWCRKATGRLNILHCKDFAYGVNDKPAFAEIGFGNLDFSAILPAAEEAGCEWFVVEQDTCPGDPFVSLEKSFKTMESFAQ